MTVNMGLNADAMIAATAEWLNSVVTVQSQEASHVETIQLRPRNKFPTCAMIIYHEL